MAKQKQGNLAEAYNHALALEKAGNIEESAIAWRRVLEIDPADRGGAAVRLAAMGRGDAPAKAPSAYVATLFDQHAETFDDILVNRLRYSVPEQLRAALLSIGVTSVDRMLDLGCGTGLTGLSLKGIAGHMTGADIAENMVSKAWDRGVYNELYVYEAVSFLEESDDDKWDLITATDVMPYLGDLEPFVTHAASCLSEGGRLAFSTETLPENVLNGRPWMVGPAQRFAHSEAYIRGLLGSFGFEIELIDPITVRREKGAPVPGHLVVAQIAPQSLKPTIAQGNLETS